MFIVEAQSSFQGKQVYVTVSSEQEFNSKLTQIL